MGECVVMMASNSTYVLAIDVGTESIRVGVYDRVGRLHATASCACDLLTPQPGWAEQDPQQWWAALRRVIPCALHKAGIEGSQIMAVAVDATASTVLMTDAEGEPLGNAILWMDTRAAGEVEDIAATQHPVLRYSGEQDAVEWMTPKALWLKRNRPEQYAQAAHICECLDWINFKLTGQWAASICQATCKWNYISREGGWSDEFLAAVGLEDVRRKWPALVLPLGDWVGALTADCAKELGLRPAIPVGQGGVDAHVGMLGMGVTEAGMLSMTMGSSAAYLGLSQEPVWHPAIWGPYPDAVVPGLYVIEGGQVSTGSITRWYRDEFGDREAALAETEGRSAYAVLTEAALAVPAGAEGLLALDFWQGNRTPYRDPWARGAFIGLTLRHTRAHLYRAILEAVAFGARNVLKSFAEAGCPFERIVVGGGGAQNRAWLQIHADVCGRPLTLAGVDNTSLLGTAICAATAAGWYADVKQAAAAMSSTGDTVEPNPAVAERYDFMFAKYTAAYSQLKEILADLSRSMG